MDTKELQKLINVLDKAPEVRLLRADNRNMILRFCAEAYPEGNEWLRENEFLFKLERFLEHDGDEDLDYEALARKYMNDWRNAGYFNRIAGDNTYVYELGQAVARVLVFAEDLIERPVVVADANFGGLASRLEDLVLRAEEDPDAMIEMKEAQIRKLQDEIDRIKTEGRGAGDDVEALTAILRDLERDAKRYLADLDEVSTNFARIADDIFKREIKRLGKRAILSEAFAEMYMLKNSPQGKSFYVFKNFIDDDDSWEKKVARMYYLLQEKGVDCGTRYLSKYMGRLRDAAAQVHENNNRLAMRLSAIIKRDTGKEGAALRAALLGAMEAMVNAKDADIDYGLEMMKIGLDLPMLLKLNLKDREQVEFKSRPRRADKSSTSATLIAEAKRMRGIPDSQIIGKIDESLAERHCATLGEVIKDAGGLSRGLTELLQYVDVLSRYYKDPVKGEVENVPLYKEGTLTTKIAIIPKIIIKWKKTKK